MALPAIAEDLATDSAGLQWILNGYLLTLAAFLLLGGSLGDSPVEAGAALFPLTAEGCDAGHKSVTQVTRVNVSFR